MQKGTIILLSIAGALLVIFIVLKTKQKTAPTYSLGDLFTSIKAQLGIK